MPRYNGSYIGIDANPNANEASGLWTVREAERLLRADKWPATPTVPGAPNPVAGDEQVSLTWTAPTGGSAPTDYVVQYSSDGGANWTTFNDGVSTNTSATVTGLTNGTAYIFRIQAINVLGEGPFGSASGSVTPAAGVVPTLLLHFDGTDESTTFTDSSPNAFSVSAVGDAQVDTARSQFGGASALLDGDGDRLEVETDGELALGESDFTLEMWVYPPENANDNEHVLFSQASPTDTVGIALTVYQNDLMWLAEGGSGWEFQRYPGGSDFDAGALVVDDWNHLAITRSGTTLRLYANGNLVDTVTDYSFSMTDPNELVSIGGRDNFGQGFTGSIDELRLVIGTALYTGATYTVPAEAFS
jgi:hypothetical protein